MDSIGVLVGFFFPKHVTWSIFIAVGCLVHLVLLISGSSEGDSTMTQEGLGEALSSHIVTTNKRKLKPNKELH